MRGATDQVTQQVKITCQTVVTRLSFLLIQLSQFQHSAVQTAFAISHKI